MYAYNVYFSLKDGISETELKTIFQRFVESEKARNHMASAQLIQITNKANFTDIPDYRFSAIYRSDRDRQQALEDMRSRYTEEPHASLMRIVSDFRVAFSQDVEL